MKIECIKISQGFIPFSDHGADKIRQIENGSIIEVSFKTERNYKFHSKVFAFLQYCYNFWINENEYQTERVSFDVFRKNLLVIAGYKDIYYKIDGSFRVEAKSMAYGNMTQDEFEDCYHALIQAAMDNLFSNNPEEYDTLISFF